MNFQNLLSEQSAVIPNMLEFTTSSSVSLECLTDMCDNDEVAKSVALANQIMSDGILLAGGQYHPDNTSMGVPFTLSKALNALESIAPCYDSRNILRPGTLIEFANYIYSGGQITHNCLVAGDEKCPTYFQFLSRDSMFWLRVPSKIEYPADKHKLTGCHGIFVVSEPRT